MWVAMWTRCPASGTRSTSVSPALRARSGCGDISMRWMYMCSRPGWRLAPLASSSVKAVSRTSIASRVLAPSAGSPVTRSQSSQGVRFMMASANSAQTSRSLR